MKIRVERLFELPTRWPESTAGVVRVDGEVQCFTLEDQHQAVKVPGETRIPAGTYRVSLRKEGGMHSRYADRYSWHRGMLWLRDVPGFEYVLIHPGNTERDTAGCILVGDGLLIGGELSQSLAAYRRLYEFALKALEAGEAVDVEVVDPA